MNLLAHAVLSPANEKIRIGNVLADFVGRNEKEALDAEIQKGFRLHRLIDQFTDSHSIVDRSKARLNGFQRFGNALVDVFYDHFLTKNWTTEISVRDFTNELYSSIKEHEQLLPDNCNHIASRMVEQDWMNNYGTIEGLILNLGRMESRIKFRTGRTVDLVSSLQILDSNYLEFEADFREFWPQLVGHVS